MALCAFVGLCSSLCLLFMINIPLLQIKILLFALGFATAAQPLTFVEIQNSNPAEVSRAAIGFNNTAVILGGALLQPISSFIISHSSKSNYYVLTDYYHGLLLMPLCFFLSLPIIYMYLKEDLKTNYQYVKGVCNGK